MFLPAKHVVAKISLAYNKTKQHLLWVYLTLKPNWAALMAATYPPGPEPMTVTSASTIIRAD